MSGACAAGLVTGERAFKHLVALTPCPTVIPPSTSFPRKRESLPPFHVIPAQAGILFTLQWIPALATLGRNDAVVVIPAQAPRHSCESRNPFPPSTSFPRKRESLPPFHVIPAQAGILFTLQWIPAFATLGRNDTVAVFPAQAPQSFLRKQESLPPFHVIPA
ncbi:hypothetical protein Calab_3778 [Caldithrix abyssi DSM 13497]|uniref:Uncharacterized protein n=1 Tax=Caldithrix abyssi DSM 13497 TaxID=880073 RepID=H1XQ70_CALAY|nr:hypothetical protein Calab_3778 [Caldithrix abyssi DSM 13497]